MTVIRKKVTKAGITVAFDAEIADVEEIKRIIWRPGGAGNADLKRRADNVARTAVAGAPKRSGTLARSIRVEQARTVGGQFDAGYAVTANTPYALYVHEGTRPHTITGNPLLVFDWPKGGRHPAVLRRVNHPGTRAQPFLADAIRAAV